MEEFLKALDDFWAKHEATYEEDGKYFFEEDKCGDDYREIESLIWEKLLTTNWWKIDTKKFIEENGYHCFAGDKDSFGLLVACVGKDNKYMSIG